MSNVKTHPMENPSEPWCRLWLPAETWDRFRGIDADFTEDSKNLVLAPLLRSDALETLSRRLGEKHAEEFLKQLRDLHLLPVACWPQGLLIDARYRG